MSNIPILGFTLSNGARIDPTVIDCSLGLDGNGPPGLFGTIQNNEINRYHSTTVLKSITYKYKEGNFGAPWWLPKGWALNHLYIPLPKKFCYTKVNDGNGSTVNSFGLSNEGFTDFFHHQDFRDKEIIPSIFIELGSGNDEDIQKALHSVNHMGKSLSQGETAKGYKIAAVIANISCPNDRENGVCVFNDHIVMVMKAFKKALGDIPLGIKYSYMQDISLAVALNKEVDIAFHQAINTIPFKEVYGDKKFSPLSHIGHGGVSGPDIKDMALEYGKQLRAALPDAYLILGGGISSLEDAIERAKVVGDKGAIAMGILVNNNTEEANRIIKYLATGG